MALRRYEAVMKAVADPTRVRILKMLEAGELCVCQVIAVLALSPSTVSKHLFLLKSAGLVVDRKEKKWVHYALDRASGDPYVEGMLRELSAWLDRDPVVVADRARLRQAKRDTGPASGDRRAARARRGSPAPRGELVRRLTAVSHGRTA